MADGSSSKSRTARTARLEARTTPDVRDQIERAAALQGRSVSDFVIASALEAAQRAITTTEIIQLSREASIAFANALIDPPEPTEALRKAAADYRAAVSG
jgi:uncharacterized protein (DUF1778 family)